MFKLGLVFGLMFVSAESLAQKSSVKDVTVEYAALGLLPDLVPTPTPAPGASPAPTVSPTDTVPIPGTNTNTDTGGKLGQLIALGTKIWDFIVTNKPTADYDVFKTSVVPEGITNWIQLKGWAKQPVSKVYRVEFTNMFGQPSGGFDYRITYFHSGSYQGHGKFLGQISVVPTNIHLKTDRSLKMKVELAGIVNFGTEEEPLAGAQLIINWSSPTTTRYEMYSAEYLIYGDGEITDLSNGN